jgi:nicotinamide-nucleotide amidase
MVASERVPSAEIIAIGSELLTPDRSDSNSLWLTQKLNDIGIEVKCKSVVGDDEVRLEEAIRDALKRSEIIITTGGLGPTEDDVTRHVAARAVGRKLTYHDEIEADLRERFRRWGREMPEINKRQAYVIEGAVVLPNPNGSAPGMLLELDKKFLVVLPGPPREMQPMFEHHAVPKLREVSGGVLVRRRIIRVTGMGESAVDEAIAPIYKAYTNVQTSILFNKSEVEVHIAASSRNEREVQSLLDRLSDKIADRLGLAVFTTTDESMEQVIARLLTEQKATVSVAESCTGGLIAQRLTDLPGSSVYFLEGAVTYSNEAKIRNLGVSRETLEKHGAVSSETAQEMAAGMKERAGSDYAISVTGIAGPDGGSEDKPVGTVWFGLADNDGVKTKMLLFPGDRYLIRWRSSQAALDLLRRRILVSKYPGSKNQKQ